ncbi:MAG: CBS domain-containing protein [Gammaproteobacteria bacterium]|nr:MAG: CBS domain-containing protein [Gammaproteobacteria bacterium]
MTSQNVVVGDVMSDRFVLMDGLVTVYDALQEMKRNSAVILMVNKKDSGDEFGVVVLSDIAKKVLAKDRSPERVNVYEIMTKPVISVHSKMKIKYCARLFLQFGIACAPVIENGEVLGVVSYEALVMEGLVMAGANAIGA